MSTQHCIECKTQTDTFFSICDSCETLIFICNECFCDHLQKYRYLGYDFCSNECKMKLNIKINIKYLDFIKY